MCKNKIVLYGLCLVASEVFGSLPKECSKYKSDNGRRYGVGDVGFNGNLVVRTSNMVTLDGVVMERFYSVAPLSSLTPASVLS